jgi:hypothetical protein
MKSLTEEELEIAIIKFNRRMKTFQEEGLSENDAYELADKLFIRDTEEPWDDRRLCFECKQYQPITKTCPKVLDFRGKPSTPLRFLLQRCEHFILKGQK